MVAKTKIAIKNFGSLQDLDAEVASNSFQNNPKQYFKIHHFYHVILYCIFFTRES